MCREKDRFVILGASLLKGRCLLGYGTYDSFTDSVFPIYCDHTNNCHIFIKNDIIRNGFGL